MPDAVTTPDNDPRRRNGAAGVFAVRLIIFMLTAMACLSGALEPLNMALMDARFRLTPREASGTLALVEIDPYSLREEGRWPWTRAHHAGVIRNLQDSGADLIAFDVDFSSPSDAAGDAALADALARRPGEVVLPVFWQWASRSQDKGQLLRTPPNAAFLKDSVVAAVTLTTEDNGAVRQGWRSFRDDDGAERQSVAAVLAGAPPTRAQTFYIDYGFDPGAIEHLSFHDVLTGDFDAEKVRGRKVLIGATALELGDEFPAPLYGVTPGVLFHALAYESLIADRAIARLHPGAALGLAAAAILLLTGRGQRRGKWRIAALHGGVFVVLTGGPLALQAAAPVSLDAGAALFAQALCAAHTLGYRLRDYAGQALAQRAAAARFQALTALVMRDTADGVIVATPAGAVELANDRAGALLGASLAPGVALAAVAPGFPSPHDGDGNNVSAEYQPRGAGDVTLEVIATVSSDAGGGEALVVYNLHDVSARKRIEDAEREAKEAAIAANRMKSQLIANMSHELRTPLNGVIGFADLMKQEAFGPHGVAEYKDYSDTIWRSGRRLLGLVNDMLNIAKLDAGEFELAPSPAHIDEIIEAKVLRFEEEAERDGKSLRVQVEKGLPAMAIDAGVFREMLSHLLSNALKFTSEGGKILVRARARDGALIVEVIDDGCGAPRALLPRLTEAFYQADGALSRKHEGAGLGLYLTAKFAALHGGTLTCESDEGAGFIARLEFPGMADKAGAKSAA